MRRRLNLPYRLSHSTRPYAHFICSPMPRKYKSLRVKNDASNMERAVKLVVEDGLTLRRASDLMSIPFQTLARLVNFELYMYVDASGRVVTFTTIIHFE